MEVHEQEASRPLFKRWRLVVASVFLGFACVFGAVAYRNVQQWNVALKLRRQAEATGGEAEFMQVYGADFCPLSPIMPKQNPGQSLISWPVVRLVSIRDRAPAKTFRDIDWSQLPRLRTIHLRVNHPEFTDNDLNSIPEDAQFTDLDIASSGITNASIDKIKRLSRLESISIEGSQIDGTGLLRLATETNLAVQAQLTAADLQALETANALHRIKRGTVLADETFRAVQLKGLDDKTWIVFQGKFHPDALSGISDFYKQDNLQFRHAELRVENLVDIAKMNDLATVFFTECKIKGSLNKEPGRAVDDASAFP